MQTLRLSEDRPRRFANRMTPKIIMVQCINAHLRTTYVRIGVGPRSVEIAFGVLWQTEMFVIPSPDHVSTLHYHDNPELTDLHDGTGWNLEELAAFVAGLEDLDELDL